MRCWHSTRLQAKLRHTFRYLLAPCALGIAAAACSSSNALTGVSSESPSQAQVSHISTLRGWMSPESKNAKRFLYVSVDISGTQHFVNVFWMHDDARKASLVGRITDGIDKPEGLATDTKGNLYVANLDSKTVTVYRPQKTRPSLKLKVPDSPLDVAVGSNGYVYVGDEAGGIDVYPPGATSPSRRLTNPGLTRAAGVAVSSSNDVYADGESGSSSYYTPAVVEFTNATGSGKDLGLSGLFGRLAGVIVTNDDLIVTDFDEDEVLTYPLGKTSYSSTISVTSPVRPALSKAQHKIYVPSTYSADTGVYDYPSGKIVTNIQGGDTGAAFSPALTP
jgi:hypothetical protein